MRAVAFACAVAVLAMCAASVQPAQAAVVAGDWSEIFVLDCNTVGHVLPSQPLLSSTVDMTLARQAISYFQAAIEKRALCRCPNLDQTSIDTRFGQDLIGTLLRWAEPKPSGNPPYQTACQGNGATSFFRDVLGLGDSIDVTLPSTCTSAGWESGGTCAASYAFGQSAGAGDASKINVMFDHCAAGTPSAGKGLPYVSVTCTGPRCTDYMRVCQSASDCGTGTTCGLPFAAWTHASATNWISTQLRKFSVYGPDAECAGVGAATSAPGEWVLQRFLSQWITDLWGGQGSVNADRTVADLKICGGGPDFTSAGNDINRCTFPVSGGVRTVNCGFSTWDGVLPGGEASNSAARKNGDGRRTLPTAASVGTPSGAVHVASLTCDNKMAGLLSDSALHTRAVGPQVQRMAQSVLGVARDLAQCRTNRGAGFSDLPAIVAPTNDQFDARYNLASLTGPLAFGSVHPAFDIGSATSDLYRYIAYQYNVATTGTLGPVDNTQFPQLVMPAGCTLADWLATGRCSFKYEGASGLFAGFDATLRFDFKKCGNSDNAALPNSMSVHVDCVGADCTTLLEPFKMTYCTQDSDCPAPANPSQPAPKCNSIGPLAGSFKPYIGYLTTLSPPFLGKQFWQKTGKYAQMQFWVRPPSGSPTFFSDMTAQQRLDYISSSQYLNQLANAVNDFNAAVGCYSSAYYTDPPNSACTNITGAVFDLLPSLVQVATISSQSCLLFSVEVMPGRAGTDVYTPWHIADTLQTGANDINYVLWQSGAYPGAPITPFYMSYSVLRMTAMYCPTNGQYVTPYGPTTTCTGYTDTCDDDAHYEADVVQFLRVFSGQSWLDNIDTTPTALRGFCTLATANATNIRPWAKSVLTYETDSATNLRVSKVGGLQSYFACANPGDTCDPDNGATGLARPAVLPIALALLAVAVAVRKAGA